MENGAQITSEHYRTTAKDFGTKLSRTAYRHPDGNAFVERMFPTLKEEAVWRNNLLSFDEAFEAIIAGWTITTTNDHTTHSGTELRAKCARRC